MLKHDFELRIPELEDELPASGSTVDIARIWKIARQAVKTIPDFEITEQIVLTTLSFTKFLLWKDLVDRTEQLKRNAVVKHLIDTPTHSFGEGDAEFVQQAALDYTVHPSDLFTPLSANSSQVTAVVAAQRGKSFVLFGPPGTGKSQTIVNLITQLPRPRPDRPLRFAEDRGARGRPPPHGPVGLGDYCLEVHSTKAQKSAVLEQLKVAWTNRTIATETDWAAATSDLKKKRDELNRLVLALHRRRPNGMTAYEAFGRVVADRGSLPEVRL